MLLSSRIWYFLNQTFCLYWIYLDSLLVEKNKQSNLLLCCIQVQQDCSVINKHKVFFFFNLRWERVTMLPSNLLVQFQFVFSFICFCVVHLCWKLCLILKTKTPYRVWTWPWPNFKEQSHSEAQTKIVKEHCRSRSWLLHLWYPQTSCCACALLRRWHGLQLLQERKGSRNGSWSNVRFLDFTSPCCIWETFTG